MSLLHIGEYDTEKQIQGMATEYYQGADDAPADPPFEGAVLH